MHLTGACHWPRPSDCKTDANSSLSGKRTPRVICIVYGVCVWSYLRGAEETDPHSPLRACGRNVWVGRILPLFSFLLVVPMVPIARVRMPFQWLVSIGVGYLRSFAWRFGGYKCVGLIVVLGPKDAQRVQMEPTGCYSYAKPIGNRYINKMHNFILGNEIMVCVGLVLSNGPLPPICKTILHPIVKSR